VTFTPQLATANQTLQIGPSQRQAQRYQRISVLTISPLNLALKATLRKQQAQDANTLAYSS